MQTNNENNKKILWVSLAGLALLGAVAVYAINSPGAAEVAKDMKEGGSEAVSTTKVVVAQPRTLTLPAGTAMAMTLQTTLSTKTAEVGDRFTARVSEPVTVAGRTAIPEGAVVEGHVALTEQPGKASGRGKMQLSYDTVRFAGRSYEIDSVSRLYLSDSGTGKDAAMIGGGAVAGAVAGKIIGGDSKDAGKGEAVGAVAGTAASLLTRGPQLKLEAGTPLVVSLDRAVTVRPAESA